jgi:hypothetical protein
MLLEYGSEVNIKDSEGLTPSIALPWKEARP